MHQDDRELLDESAIVARALASPAAGRLPEGTTLANAPWPKRGHDLRNTFNVNAEFLSHQP